MTESVLLIIIYHKNVVVALPGGRMTLILMVKARCTGKRIEKGFLGRDDQEPS